MQTSAEFVVVRDAPAGTCGIVVWWTLSGNLSWNDLKWNIDSVGSTIAVPSLPSEEVVALRAVNSILDPAQRVVVARKRRIWEVETSVTKSVDGRDSVQHIKDLRIEVDDEGNVKIDPADTSDPFKEDMATSAREKVKEFRDLLTPNDISAWLTCTVSRACHAVTLRSTGGFYFIPKHMVDTWRQVVEALESCSQHRVQALPAMTSEEAVNTLLGVIAAESRAAFDDFDAYLAGKTSTKGLNAVERDRDALLAKVEAYQDLLGGALPWIQERLELLNGAIAAARIGQDAKA